MLAEAPAPDQGPDRAPDRALGRLSALVRRWNGTVNLVAPGTLAELEARHVADSAQLWGLRPAGARTWADLGSGGGFPGLVVAALAGPEAAVALVESDARKCAFLRAAAQDMGLTVTILEARAEALPPLGADVVSARALAPLPRLLPLVARHLREGGTAILPKGRAWEAEVEEARRTWGFDLDARPSATDADARVLLLTRLARRP